MICPHRHTRQCRYRFVTQQLLNPRVCRRRELSLGQLAHELVSELTPAPRRSR